MDKLKCRRDYISSKFFVQGRIKAARIEGGLLDNDLTLCHTL